MPLAVVGQNPFGVVVQKADGSTVTIPHGIAQGLLPLLAQADAPPAADAPVQPDVSDAMPAPPAPAAPPDTGAPAVPDVPMFRGAGAAPMVPTAPPAQAPAGGMEGRHFGPRGPGIGALPLATPAAPPAPAPGPAPAGGAPALAPRRQGAAPPDPGKLLLQGMQDESKAALGEGDAEARAIDYAGPRAAEAYKQSIAANASAQLDFQSFMGRINERSDALGQEIVALSQERIHPTAYLENESTAGKLFALAGIVAGGLGSGATGGRNEGLSVVQKLIDQNIQAQVTNLEHRRGMAHDKMTMLQQDVARGMDVYSAATKARAVALEQTAKLIEAEGSKFQSDIARARATTAAAKLREEGAKTYASYRTAQEQVGVEYYKANLGYQQHIMMLQHEAQKEQRAVEADQRKRVVISPFTGQPIGFAQDEERARKATEISAKYTAFIHAAKDYRDLIVQYGRQTGGPGKGRLRQELEGQHAFLFKAARDWSNSGANLTEIEVKNLLDPIAPKPEGLFSITNPIHAVDATLTNSVKEFNRTIRAYVPGAAPIAPPTFEEQGGTTHSAARQRYDQEHGESAVDPAEVNQASRDTGNFYGSMP